VTIKAYQPQRTDLLINTTWGIAQEQLADSEAQTRGLKLIQDRWVSPEERQQLKDQAGAYRSLRALACLLLVIAFLSIFWTISAVKNSGLPGLLVIRCGLPGRQHRPLAIRPLGTEPRCGAVRPAAHRAVLSRRV
jgi:hypothetical protein